MLLKKSMLPFLLCVLSFFSLITAVSVYEFNSKQESFDDVLKKGKPVVAKFYQPWCPACKSYKKPFETVAQEFPNVIFVAIDCGENPDLERKYGVQGYPTTIFFDSNGMQVEKQPGGMDDVGLSKKVKNLK